MGQSTRRMLFVMAPVGELVYVPLCESYQSFCVPLTEQIFTNANNFRQERSAGTGQRDAFVTRNLREGTCQSSLRLDPVSTLCVQDELSASLAFTFGVPSFPLPVSFSPLYAHQRPNGLTDYLLILGTQKHSLEKLLFGGSTHCLESRVCVESSHSPCPERSCSPRSNVPDASNNLECRRRTLGVDGEGRSNNAGLTSQQATVLDRLRRFSQEPRSLQYGAAANGEGRGRGSIGDVEGIKRANGGGGRGITQRGDHDCNGGEGGDSRISTAFSTRPAPVIMSHPAVPSSQAPCPSASSRIGSRILEDEPIYYATSGNAEVDDGGETRVGAVVVPSLDFNMLRFPRTFRLLPSLLLSNFFSVSPVSGIT